MALHGIQSHGGWYQYSCTRLAAAGYEVFFLDRRGSGLNWRQRGHVIHGERVLADVRQFLRQLAWERRAHSPAPPILMGVSWGGKLATACAATLESEISGLALLYPGLYSRVRPSWWQRWQLGWASAVGWGQVATPIPLNDPRYFTDSRAWQEYIRRDELALQHVTVDFMRANIWLSQLIEERAGDIHGPVLMMLAGQDEMIDNVANRNYLRRLKNATTLLKEYPQARHTLEFEPNPDEFIDDLVTWLNEVSVHT